MAYSTVQDVRLALSVGASGLDGTMSSEVSDDQIADNIAEADAQIDGYLSVRYAVPVTGTVPPLLKFLSRDLAAYLTQLTWLGSVDMGANDPVKLRLERANHILDDLRNGKMTVPLDPAGDDTSQFDPYVLNPYDGSMFTLDQFDLIEGQPLDPSANQDYL